MLLQLPLILEIRRNHALEHATLHMLARKYPNRRMAGHSNPMGFFLLGDLSTDEVQAAAMEALTRLRAGESGLAIHPGCGTNLVTAALLPATLAWIPLRGVRAARWRFFLIPLALTFALFGFLLSRPLGPWLQKHITTEANVGNLQIVEVQLVRKGIHRIITRNQ
ncbi:MAG TPA: DUF6391 domain-containing protein [Anaerolineales bacterium]|nr:DUF6391 domain-containing protein [Anaerolineales bacterium]